MMEQRGLASSGENSLNSFIGKSMGVVERFNFSLSRRFATSKSSTKSGKQGEWLCQAVGASGI